MSNIEEHLQQEHQTRVDAINQDHQKEIDGNLSLLSCHLFSLSCVLLSIPITHVRTDIQERYTKKIKEIQAQNTLTVTSLQSELDKKKKASVCPPSTSLLILSPPLAFISFCFLPSPPSLSPLSSPLSHLEEDRNGVEDGAGESHGV